VLRHAVLVVRLKHANHVRIVPVRPHSRLGYVVRKELLEPEQPLRGRTSTRIIRYRYPLLKKRREGLSVFRRRRILVAATSSRVFPSVPRMPS
jgi:hypothetical protein